MEQDHIVLASPPCSFPFLFFIYFLPVENFNQIIILIREVRSAETKENSQERLNNNNAVIKNRQGPLVLSLGL